MERGRWFLVLTPVVVQSVALIILSNRFATTFGKAGAVFIGIGGIAGALAAFFLIERQERRSTRFLVRNWADRMAFVLGRLRHDMTGDLRALTGWLKLGDIQKALEYLVHLGQRLDAESSLFRNLDPRTALALMTGEAISRADGSSFGVEVEDSESRAPYCEGLGESLERVIAFVSSACKSASGGQMHIKCAARGERWQIRVLCSAPFSDERAAALALEERASGGDFHLRTLQEIDKGSGFIFDFPKRSVSKTGERKG
jgi:hypothetical protein